jgi:prolipoprotein diacylglyceryl transferase
MTLAYIPSPSEGVWHLGPLPLRAYALAIIVGIIVAIWIGERRFVARGGRSGTVSDVAVWAIPFGLVGARIYHVATNPEFYFGDGKEPIQALYVWEGGLGIWGAIGFGALGAYLGCRYSGVKFTSYIDAVAPGIVLAQAIGRWGNYFNQELFGKPTDTPWGLEIDLANRPDGYLEYSTFQPTFLYESLWCIVVAAVVVLADRRYRLGRGRVFALYVALYTAGRAWIEDLRIDDAHEFGPFRLNVWVAIALFVLAMAYFVIVGRLRPGREASVYRRGEPQDGGGEDEAAEGEETKAAKTEEAEAEAVAAESVGDDDPEEPEAEESAGTDSDADAETTDADESDTDESNTDESDTAEDVEASNAEGAPDPRASDRE